MLPCGTADSASTHITRQKLTQLTEMFLLKSLLARAVLQMKSICATLTVLPEHMVGATALNFSVDTTSVDRVVVTSQQPQTELHYPDSKYYVKYSKIHMLPNNEASSNRLNIKTRVYPVLTNSGVSKTCNKPNILYESHKDTTISSVYQRRTQIMPVCSAQIFPYSWLNSSASMHNIKAKQNYFLKYYTS